MAFVDLSQTVEDDVPRHAVHRYSDGDDLANLPGVAVSATPEGAIEPETLPDTGLTGRAVLGYRVGPPLAHPN